MKATIKAAIRKKITLSLFSRLVPSQKVFPFELTMATQPSQELEWDLPVRKPKKNKGQKNVHIVTLLKKKDEDCTSNTEQNYHNSRRIR